MNRYVATFHTHLAAMRTHRALVSEGVPAEFAPVPRKLSASCGTCVLYEADGPMLACLDRDAAAAAQIESDGTYRILYQNE